MHRYAVLEKKRGQTPLAALRAYQSAHPEYARVPASYAGRLDPMAEGKLLVLFGEECKKQKRYAALDKEYEIEVLLDVGSDTGDALGLVSYQAEETRVQVRPLRSALAKEEGKHIRKYPAYSSKTLNGKPLFLHALEGTLVEADIPEHEECIYRIRLLGSERISVQTLRARILEFLALVPKNEEPSKALGADFRIEAVRRSWDSVFALPHDREFALIRLRIACGSGTYMRSLAGRIGESLGTKALALSIRRTKIGKRWLGLWLTSYGPASPTAP